MIVAESLRDQREIKGLCGKHFSANIMSHLKIIPLFIIKNSHLSVEGPPGHRPKDNDHEVNFQEPIPLIGGPLAIRNNCYYGSL